MRTITTREQLLVNGKVRERIATHIVTGAHGYETLCTSGYNLQYNKERVHLFFYMAGCTPVQTW